MNAIRQSESVLDGLDTNLQGSGCSPPNNSLDPFQRNIENGTICLSRNELDQVVEFFRRLANQRDKLNKDAQVEVSNQNSMVETLPNDFSGRN